MPSPSNKSQSISGPQREYLMAQLWKDVEQSKFNWAPLFANSDKRALLDRHQHMANPELRAHVEQHTRLGNPDDIEVNADFQRLYGSRKWAAQESDRLAVSDKTRLHSQSKVEDGRAVLNCAEYALFRLETQGLVAHEKLRDMSDEMSALGSVLALHQQKGTTPKSPLYFVDSRGTYGGFCGVMGYAESQPVTQLKEAMQQGDLIFIQDSNGENEHVGFYAGTNASGDIRVLGLNVDLERSDGYRDPKKEHVKIESFPAHRARHLSLAQVVAHIQAFQPALSAQPHAAAAAAVPSGSAGRANPYGYRSSSSSSDVSPSEAPQGAVGRANPYGYRSSSSSPSDVSPSGAPQGAVGRANAYGYRSSSSSSDVSPSGAPRFIDSPAGMANASFGKSPLTSSPSNFNTISRPSPQSPASTIYRDISNGLRSAASVSPETPTNYASALAESARGTVPPASGQSVGSFKFGSFNVNQVAPASASMAKASSGSFFGSPSQSHVLTNSRNLSDGPRPAATSPAANAESMVPSTYLGSRQSATPAPERTANAAPSSVRTHSISGLPSQPSDRRPDPLSPHLLAAASPAVNTARSAAGQPRAAVAAANTQQLAVPSPASNPQPRRTGSFGVLTNSRPASTERGATTAVANTSQPDRIGSVDAPQLAPSPASSAPSQRGNSFNVTQFLDPSSDRTNGPLRSHLLAASPAANASRSSSAQPRTTTAVANTSQPSRVRSVNPQQLAPSPASNTPPKNGGSFYLPQNSRSSSAEPGAKTIGSFAPSQASIAPRLSFNASMGSFRPTNVLVAALPAAHTSRSTSAERGATTIGSSARSHASIAPQLSSNASMGPLRPNHGLVAASPAAHTSRSASAAPGATTAVPNASQAGRMGSFSVDPVAPSQRSGRARSVALAAAVAQPDLSRPFSNLVSEDKPRKPKRSVSFDPHDRKVAASFSSEAPMDHVAGSPASHYVPDLGHLPEPALLTANVRPQPPAYLGPDASATPLAERSVTGHVRAFASPAANMGIVTPPTYSEPQASATPTLQRPANLTASDQWKAFQKETLGIIVPAPELRGYVPVTSLHQMSKEEVIAHREGKRPFQHMSERQRAGLALEAAGVTHVRHNKDNNFSYANQTTNGDLAIYQAVDGIQKNSLHAASRMLSACMQKQAAPPPNPDPQSPQRGATGKISMS